MFCAFVQTADYDQGVALFDKGEFAAALPFLRRAAESDSGNAQKWKAVGVTYAALKKYSEAEETLGRACRLDYKIPDACFFYARTLYALDRFDDALVALEHADHRSWRARLARAESLEALGRFAPAEQEYRQSVALCRGADPKPAIGLGQFLVRQGRSSEAVTDLERAASAYPSSADAHLWLGRALSDTGKPAESIPHLERAVALAPSSAQAHLLLAKAYARSGRAGDAQRHFALAAQYGQPN